MTRTSPAEVRGLFRRLVKAAGKAGIDTTGWELREGAKVNPSGWWILGTNSHAGGSLGNTARDASLTLSGMVRALELVPAREPGASPADSALALTGPRCTMGTPDVCLLYANHEGPHRNGTRTWQVPTREGVR